MEGGTLAGDVVAEGAAASRGARKEERTHRAELFGGMHDDSVVMAARRCGDSSPAAAQPACPSLQTPFPARLAQCL